MKKTSSGIFLFFSVFFVRITAAQFYSTDTSQPNASLATVINFHNSVLKENIHLYNGWQGPGYNHLAIGQPYFMADSVQVGSIYYDDTYYPNVPMLYDLVNDDVTIIEYSPQTDSTLTQYVSVLRLDLVKEKIQSFSMPSHEFVRLITDSNSVSMPKGFYERMYNGNTKLFVKRVKLYIEEVKGDQLERRYELKTTYYIQKKGIYYNVSSQKSLLTALKEKKGELGSFIRSNKKRYRKNKELMILETTQHYDQLATH